MRTYLFSEAHQQNSEGQFSPPTTANPADLSRSASPQHAEHKALLANGRQNSLAGTVSPNPNMTHAHSSSEQAAETIQNILAGTKKVSNSPAGAQQSTWSPPGGVPPRSPHESLPGAPMPGPVPVQRTSTKRKLDAPDAEDPHGKIRRVVHSHVVQDPSRALPMTTVLCLHAAVAQKSYGSEKRFLCPPPVVHIESPVWNLRNQQLSMTVVSENGERSFEQRAIPDSNLSASFKFLHVTGSAKSKSFQLSLDIAEPPLGIPEGSELSVPGRTWASFDSAPVTIISKPSKKTAKTRNISSCILAGGPVSLFNRINSQTVRTKYMTVDQTQLCASNVNWSAFNVNVVRPQGDMPPLAGPQPVTYGSEIILTDTLSQTQTAPLIIRKVDKGRIASEDGGPVSQMQKIALQRVNPDGTRHYLSAAGPMPGTPGLSMSSSSANLASQAGTHPLMFQTPRVREEVKDGVRVITDEVDDYLCWTIVGISKFQYTFFDAFGQNATIPELPITPFPTLFTAPTYRAPNHTLDLTVANFFYEDPRTRVQCHLDVYVGSLGPLRVRFWPAAPPGPLTNITAYAQPMSMGPDGTPVPMPEVMSLPGMPPGAAPQVARNYMHPPGPMHTIVVVEMPPVADMMKALEDDQTTPGDAGKTNGGSASVSGAQEPKPDGPSIAGRSLPLLFIRALDGVGYHSGRAVTCENIFQNMDLANMGTPGNPVGGIDTGWLAAAQAAAAAAGAEGSMHGWSVRVI